MINKNFYPTPKKVTKIIRGLINWTNVNNMLDPSGGKGDLILGVLNAKTIEYCSSNEAGYRFFKVDRRPKTYTIEIDPILRSALTKTNFSSDISDTKDIKVIGSDFLNYQGQIDFDLIVMNPPFDHGDQHFLKAWDILNNGQLFCILNIETINNPFSKNRKLIKKIIEDNKGEVIELGQVFKDAERKTNVSCVLVKIIKKTEPFIKLDFSDLKEFEEKGFSVDSTEDKFIVAKDEIQQQIEMYNYKIKLYKNVLKNMAKFHYYGGKDFKEYNQEYTKKFNEYILELTKESWKNIINLPKFSKFMTQDVRKQFNKQIEDISLLEFNEENILNFLDTLVYSFESIMESALLNIFEILTRYDKENRCHPEGWWTNDSYKVNKKVIIPRIWEGYSFKLSLKYELEQLLDDIDKVMQWLSGDRLEAKKSNSGYEHTYINGIVDKIEKSIKSYEFGKLKESHFFSFRYYKKGTLHLTFKSDKLWQEFNIQAALKKNWLPDDYKSRRKEKIKKGMLIEYK